MGKPYTYRKLGGRYVLSLANSCDVVDAITAFCKEMEIVAGVISGIGAVDKATLRFFNPQTKKYVDKTFCEQMEIAALVGNVSTLDGVPYLHLHATFGREDYSAIAGHLLSATLCGAGEIVLEPYAGSLPRRFDESLGLNVYDI